LLLFDTDSSGVIVRAYPMTPATATTAKTNQQMREDPCVPVDDDDDALGSAFRVFLPVSKWFCSDMVEGDDEGSREEFLSREKSPRLDL